VVKPILISRTGKTPLILVMLRVIGGALVFGFIRIHRTDAARCRLRVDRRMERAASHDDRVRKTTIGSAVESQGAGGADGFASAAGRAGDAPLRTEVLGACPSNGHLMLEESGQV